VRNVRIMLLTAVWLTCGGQRRPPERQMTSGQEDNVCPTGQSCGSSAPYCRDETATGTTGARLIKSLPYRVLSSGKYYLDKDLTSPSIAIAVLADDVSINLNGHSITYGTGALGKGASPIGEYGILICNTGNLLSEQLDSSYSSNGLCKAGGVSARNVTIERGSLIQSPNASQYYDPLNCPGSGVGNACSHHHESSASDVINAQYTSGITLRHLTLTWQNVDSDGAHLAWQLAGQGHKIECNTFHDKVTQINVRAYQRGIPINGTNARQADHPDLIRYNTLIGSPQSGIVAQAPGTVIEHNDINQGYYQFPPFTPEGKMYSNDYAIGACVKGGTVAYNYVHSVSGRGVGCIFAGDMGGMKIHHNFVRLIELDANGEYGPNGEKPGASWVGGCEINGGRGFESKESPNIQIYNNTFILSAGQCGAAGIVFVGFPCREVGCPASLDPFVVRDNTIQLENVAGVKKQPYAQAFACFLLNGSQGNYDNYFSPIAGNKCITDGDFVTTEGYGPGNHFVFQNDLFSRGEHPLSSGCGGSPESPCGFLMHWHGQQEPAPDELGFVFRDMTFSNDATSSFFGDGGTPLARSASVEWTYSVAVARSDDAAPVRSATVSVVDAHGRDAKCVTDGAGKCSVILVQTYISSEAGNASLRKENRNPQKVTITADGCRSLTYEFESKSSFEERELLDCSAPPHP
jgi:hypothetical protein